MRSLRSSGVFTIWMKILGRMDFFAGQGFALSSIRPSQGYGNLFLVNRLGICGDFVFVCFIRVSFGCLVCCLHLLIWMLFTMISQIATIVIVLVFVPSLFFMVNSHYFVKCLEKILEKKTCISQCEMCFFPSKISPFLQKKFFGGRGKKKRKLFFVCLFVFGREVTNKLAYMPFD